MWAEHDGEGGSLLERVPIVDDDVVIIKRTDWERALKRIHELEQQLHIGGSKEDLKDVKW